MGFLVKNIENFNEYKNIQYTNQADAMSLSIIGMIGRSDIALYQTVKNTVVDPHAADIVFRSDIPIVMHPLDVTNQTTAPGYWIDSFQ